MFDGEQFVSFGHVYEGNPIISTSVDGIDWDEKPFAGLESGSNVVSLAEHDATFVAVIEQWDYASEDDFSPFGPTESPTYLLAMSNDLEGWTFDELSVQAEPETQASITGMAFGESGVVMLLETYSNGPDEMRILFEAGIITEEDFENYCGLEFTGDAIVVNSCDYTDFDESSEIDFPSDADFEEFDRRYHEAESDEERAALEAEFNALMGQPSAVPIATITSDDPLFAQLDGIYDAVSDDMAPTTVLAGQPGEQLAIATLPCLLYTSPSPRDRTRSRMPSSA